MGGGTPMNKLTIEEKRYKYDAGDYMIPPPPVHTTAWSRDNWIDFIDAHGKWL